MPQMTGSATESNLTPMSLPPGAADAIAAIGPDNPQMLTPEKMAHSRDGVSEEDIAELVRIATEYRNQWAADRQERFRIWMKNVLMYKGTQVLQWDSNQGMWFDALSWYRQNRQEDGEEVNLERWINNITLMLGTAWVGNMSRGVPRTVVRPENANVLADVTTARAASEAISIIERRNQIRQMVRGEFEDLYLYGCYFKYTRGVLDGAWSGWDEEPVFAAKIVAVEAGKQCYGCGRRTSLNDLARPSNGNGLGIEDQDEDQDNDSLAAGVDRCPGCGMGMGPETYQPESQRQTVTVVGVRRTPRAMVRQTIHSPLEVDADPSAKRLEQTAILALDQEIDIGESRMMLPALRDKLQEGAPAATTQLAEYERLRRAEVTSVTSGFPADTVEQRPTYSQIWMQPISFYRTGKYDFADRMLAKYPDGLRLTMVGSETVDVRAASLTKNWTHARLLERFGLYCPSIAERVVPFNERFNATMQILDDWAQRAATGLNVVDESRLDTQKMAGRPMTPGTITGIPMRINGEPRPMAESFMHFDLPINPALWNYPQMLLTFCELISGVPPQSFGAGTQDGVETLGGQRQMLAQANTAMQPYWENVKEEHALAAQNAIECLQELMKAGAVRQIVDVVEAMGSAYRNNYVHWDMLRGKVKVYPDEDQGLPQTAEDIRAMYQMIFEEASKNNPAAVALMDVPSNQAQIMSVLAPGLEAPQESQRTKTLQDINTLLEKDWEWTVGPDGSIQQKLPVEPERRVDTFPVALETMRAFRQDNFMLRVQNPQGWARLDAYWDMLQDLDMQAGADQAKRALTVKMAGSPPPAAPDPTQAATVRELQRIASQMVDRLGQLAALDPMVTKGTANAQVSAANDVVNAALKASEAMAGK